MNYKILIFPLIILICQPTYSGYESLEFLTREYRKCSPINGSLDSSIANTRIFWAHVGKALWFYSYHYFYHRFEIYSEKFPLGIIVDEYCFKEKFGFTPATPTKLTDKLASLWTVNDDS